jgi:trans-2,3-dihydro-3-hydroxyanthranilate isomerase
VTIVTEVNFVQVDVFSTGPYTGNPLAVYPDAAHLSTEQMQAIASEMNLSETTFVTNVDDKGYDVRIFTPAEELPFAGHPTLGTCWVLRHLKRLTANEVIQRSPAGETLVAHRGGEVMFTRQGTVGPDVEEVDELADALGVPADAIGLDASTLGRGEGLLRPAVVDAGLRQMMVPLRDRGWLAACSPKPEELKNAASIGAYCFTTRGPGELQARGFFPGIGVDEDPATGVAAAGLGLYLSSHLGSIDAELYQGIEMGRPSRIGLSAAEGSVNVSGRCVLVLKGSLEELP